MWAEEPETPEELLIRKQDFAELVRRSPMYAWALLLRRSGLSVPEMARVMDRTPETVLTYVPHSSQRGGHLFRMDAAVMEARPKVCAYCGVPGVSSGAKWHAACVHPARVARGDFQREPRVARRTTRRIVASSRKPMTQVESDAELNGVSLAVWRVFLSETSGERTDAEMDAAYAKMRKERNW